MRAISILSVCAVAMFCTSVLHAQRAQRTQPTASPATLRQLADDYYNWRNQNYPVFSSDAGLHTWDNQLTD